MHERAPAWMTRRETAISLPKAAPGVIYLKGVPAADLMRAPVASHRGAGRRARALLLCAIALVAGAWSWLERPDAEVERGRRAAAEGRYDDALAAYHAALARLGADARIYLAIGAALYRQAEAAPAAGDRERLHEQAEAAFRQAARSGDARLDAAAWYNLGNTLVRLGRHDDAVEAYRRALRLHPDDDDARHNLELAERARSTQAGQGAPSRAPGAPGGSPRDAAGEQERAELADGPRTGEPGHEGPPRADAGAASSRAPGLDPGAASSRDPGLDPGPERGRSEDARAPSSERAEPGHDRDRKLDALERLSRELHRSKLRRSAGPAAQRSGKDW